MWRTTVTTTHNPPIFLYWVFSFLGKLLEWILIYSRQWKYWYLTGCHKPKIQLYLSLSSTTITGTSFGVSSVWFLLGLFNCFRCNWYDSDNIFTDFFAIDCSVVYIFGQCDLIFSGPYWILEHTCMNLLNVDNILRLYLYFILWKICTLLFTFFGTFSSHMIDDKYKHIKLDMHRYFGSSSCESVKIVQRTSCTIS